MKVLIIVVMLMGAILDANAQPAPPVPTELQILGNIISQQSQESARLMVELLKTQQSLAQEKARADAAEARLSKVHEK